MAENGPPLPSPEHSPLGIASTILAAILFAIAIISIGAIFLHVRTPYGNWPQAFLGLAVFCGGPVSALIGIPLGLIGIFQAGKRKQFAVIGLVLNLLFGVAVLIGLFVILPMFVQY